MNNSPESLIHLSRCVFMFTPLIQPVATVDSPPQNDDLSNNTTLPSFPNTVLAVDIPAQPPPTTMAWSLFGSSNIPSTSKRRERSGLRAVAQHLPGTSSSCHGAENHSIQKRIATRSVAAVHMAFFTAKANPLSVRSPFQTESTVSQVTGCCSQQISSCNRTCTVKETPFLNMSNTYHTVSDSSLASLLPSWFSPQHPRVIGRRPLHTSSSLYPVNRDANSQCVKSPCRLLTTKRVAQGVIPEPMSV